MSPSVRDIAVLAVALLAFPLAMNITNVTSSDGVPDRQTPIFHRDGQVQVPSAADE